MRFFGAGNGQEKAFETHNILLRKRLGGTSLPAFRRNNNWGFAKVLGKTEAETKKRVNRERKFNGKE